MSPTTNRRLSRVARWSALITLIAAVVVFFALPDKRWIAAILLGETVLDTVTFLVLLPRLSERRNESGDYSP